jgi:tetratricopeptide (TPR) repeat protein
MRTSVWALVVCLASGCATGRPPAPVASVTTPAAALERLASADALVRAGCLDCLIEAVGEYSVLQAFEPTAAPAARGRDRAAALIALRQLELGMVDEGYWAQTSSSLLLELARTLTLGPVPISAIPNEAALRDLLVSAPEPLGVARAAATQDELSAYLWLTLACGPLGVSSAAAPDRVEVVGELAETALVIYKEASGCRRPDVTTLEALVNGDPRFVEVHYFLGNAALAARGRRAPADIEPDLDRADRHFRLAYEWRPFWPGITLPMAHLAMTAEDFPRALEFYDKTLQMLPGQPDGMLGRVRALTYLGRHEDAIAGAEPLLGHIRLRGEARYWRAFNETQLNRMNEAWTDIELAGKVLLNVDVPKLAGIIAIRRREFDVARRKLEEAQLRHARSPATPPDCDIGFYLQTVLSEQGDWQPAAREAEAAGQCFDEEAVRLTDEIERLRGSDLPADRKGRQIARREQQLLSGARRNANARFNAAAANFNLQRKEEARRIAETLVNDQIFGQRAREIVARSQP